MIKIGYCSGGDINGISSTLSCHPSFHPKREHLSVSGGAKRCPALNDYVTSAFNVGVNYDATFRLLNAGNDNWTVEFDDSLTTIPVDARRFLLSLRDAESGVLQLALMPFWIFLSDDPSVIMTLQGAQDQTNPEPIRGQFDIYDWVRSTSYAFKFEPGEWISIESKSPIYQVKFYHPTERHFSVGEISKSEYISKAEGFSQIHQFAGPQNWNLIWRFNRRRRPKKLLKFLGDAK